MSYLLPFDRVYRLETKSVMYFRPSFVNNCPSNLLSGSPPLPHPSPRPKVKVQYTCTLYRHCMPGGGGGALSCVGDHILQESNTLFLTRYRTYKITTPPLHHHHNNLGEEGGLR
jgi:hypothetical protein